MIIEQTENTNTCNANLVQLTETISKTMLSCSAILEVSLRCQTVRTAGAVTLHDLEKGILDPKALPVQKMRL